MITILLGITVPRRCYLLCSFIKAIAVRQIQIYLQVLCLSVQNFCSLCFQFSFRNNFVPYFQLVLALQGAGSREKWLVILLLFCLLSAVLLLVKYSYFACKVQYHVAFLTSRVDKTLLSSVSMVYVVPSSLLVEIHSPLSRAVALKATIKNIDRQKYQLKINHFTYYTTVLIQCWLVFPFNIQNCTLPTCDIALHNVVTQ